MTNTNVRLVGVTDQTLTLALQGRLDAAASLEIEEQINDLCAAHAHQHLVLDLQGLTYISSMGLRLVLTLHKRCSMELVDVCPDVWNVFDMTGFTQIVKMRKAFREISLDGCTKLGEGANGTVYRIDEDTIVKLYRSDTPLAVIDQERDYAQAAFVAGIPTAISYDVVRSGDSYGIVFEMLNAATFDRKLAQPDEHFDSHIQRYVQLFQSLHATDASYTALPRMKEKYHRWIDALSDRYGDDERQAMHSLVDAVPERDTMIHGDFHPRNIMTQGDELLLIDMADISVGHPIFDLAGVGLTHMHYPTITPQTCCFYIGIEADILKRMWRMLLTQYFGTDDEAQLHQWERLVLAFTHLRYAVNPAVVSGLPADLVDSQIAFGKQFVCEEAQWAKDTIQHTEWKTSF